MLFSVVLFNNVLPIESASFVKLLNSFFSQRLSLFCLSTLLPQSNICIRAFSPSAVNIVVESFFQDLEVTCSGASLR